MKKEAKRIQRILCGAHATCAKNDLQFTCKYETV